MSFLDIFKPAAPAPVAAPAVPDPAAPNAEVIPATAPATPVVEPTPLDAFSGLWDTDPKSGVPTDQSLFGSLDPQKVFEAAKNANFAGSITPETLQAIAAGGDGAIAALQAAINSSTQAVFAQSTLATTKLIQQAIDKTNAANLANLPGLVKQHSAADSLQSENPALSNPAAAPIVSALQAQLAIKHPTATASQLKTMATDYLSNFAEVVKPTKPAAKAEPAPGEIDWSTFLP